MHPASLSSSSGSRNGRELFDSGTHVLSSPGLWAALSPQHSGYGVYPGDPSIEEASGALQGFLSLQDPFHHATLGWSTQDASCDLQMDPTRFGYGNASMPCQSTQAHEIRPRLSQTSYNVYSQNTLPPSQHYDLTPSTHISSSDYRYEKLSTSHAGYPEARSARRLETPSSAAQLPSVSPSTKRASRKSYLLPASTIGDRNTSQPSAAGMAPSQIQAHPPTGQRCEWAGCGQVLADSSCRGVREHLRDHHFHGKTLSPGDPIRCEWGGSGAQCGGRGAAMRWENLPKHIAECHTKATARRCSRCGYIFARSDTLKRHQDAGSCTTRSSSPARRS